LGILFDYFSSQFACFSPIFPRMLVIAVVLALCASGALSAGPKVSTLYGDVEGEQYRTKAGKLTKTFLGIPYASPPVGELRFKVSLNATRKAGASASSLHSIAVDTATAMGWCQKCH